MCNTSYIVKTYSVESSENHFNQKGLGVNECHFIFESHTIFIILLNTFNVHGLPGHS